MPKLSDIANVTRRGGSIPDIENELAYSGYCLYEAVKAEMHRAGNYEVVDRGRVPGLEGKVSVPTVLKFLWPDLFKDKNDVDSDRIRKALYQFLRDTRNLICISPGSMREMSTWWARNDWNDDFSAETAKPPAQPESSGTVRAKDEIHKVHAAAQSAVAVTAPAQPAEPARLPEVPRTLFRSPANEPCRYCGRTFVTQAHLTKHIYKEHESLTDLILSALTTFTVPVQLIDITRRLQADFEYTGAPETIRTRLAVMSTVAGGIVTAEMEGDKRHYSISAFIDMAKYEETVSAVAAAGLGSGTLTCREPGCGDTFFSSGARATHENSAHGKSEWRIWECAVCQADGAGHSFYNQMGWAVHTGTAHNLGSKDKQYQLLRREAARVAEVRLSDLKEADSAPPPPPPVPQAQPVVSPWHPSTTDPEPAKPLPPAPAPEPASVSLVIPASHARTVNLPTTQDIAERLASLQSSLAFISDLAQAYSSLLAENQALREKLAQASNGVPVSADTTGLQAEITDLRQQLGTLQKLMANLT